MLSVFILIAASVANLLIGFFTWLKDGRNLANSLFFALTLSLVGWSTANHFSLVSEESDRVFQSVNWVLFFVVLQNTAFHQFTRIFPTQLSSKKGTTLNTGYLLLSALAVLVGSLGGFFRGYEVSGDSITVLPSSLIAVFIIHAIASIVGIFWFLFTRLKRSRGPHRMQIKYVLFSSFLLFTLVPLTNFVFPLLLNNNSLIFLSPLYTLLFAGIIGVAILKHRLFDLKVLAARSVAYAVWLLILLLIYAAITFSITTLIFDTNTEIERIIVNSFAAFLIGVSLWPVKRAVDHYTNTLFYRDSYNPQTVIDQFSESLATELDLVNIARTTSQILSQSIKAAHVRFVVFNSDKKIFYDYGTQEASVLNISYKKLEEVEEPLVSVSELPVSIGNYYKRQKAEILIKLETPEEVMGILIIGPKLSGSYYTTQDLKLLKIIQNELSVAVQNARYFEEIQKFNVTLQRKIKQATTRLEHSNQKLKDLDEAKDEFISMASHQLRTPLTSIKGYVSMVMEGDAGKVNKQQKKLLAEAFASSQRMVYLIADLLNVSRLKTGKFLIESSDVDLSQIVQDEVEQLTPTAKQRDLTLSYVKPRKFPSIQLDETKIRQVVMNFIDNAIYYTPAGGKIKVVLKATKNHLEFTVTDNGIGIPKDQQAKLFTKFYRSPNAMKARPDGTGLGLFMARKVVLAQGGSIIFESKEGKGSTFGFKFLKAKKIKK